MSSVIFLGTPNFGSVVLQGLIEQGYEIKAVVTQPDKRVGRKQVVHQSAVKETALKHNLPVYQPAKLSGSEELAELMKIEPDFIITREKGAFVVKGEKVDSIMRKVNIGDYESLFYLHKRLDEIGLNQALKKQGIKDGDIVKIGDYEMEWED